MALLIIHQQRGCTYSVCVIEHIGSLPSGVAYGKELPSHIAAPGEALGQGSGRGGGDIVLNKSSP